MEFDPFPTLTAALDALRRASAPNEFPRVPLTDALPQLLVAFDDVPGAVELLHERATFVETETGPGSAYAEAFAAALVSLKGVASNDPVKVNCLNLTPSNAADDDILEFPDRLILFRELHQPCTTTDELEKIGGYISVILRDHPLPPDAIESLNTLNRLATEIIARARNIYADSCRDIWLAKTVYGPSWLPWGIDELETSKSLFAAAIQLDAELRARHQCVSASERQQQKAHLSSEAGGDANVRESWPTGILSGVKQGTPAVPSPGGFMSAESLTDALGVHPTRKKAFAKKVSRMRETGKLADNIWHEVAEPKPNSARYLYRSDSPALTALAENYKRPKSA